MSALDLVRGELGRRGEGSRRLRGTTEVYELTDDTLTIWAGAKGSPAYFEGTFSADGRTLDGEWVYPGGGGYRSVMTRR
ncbi:hypothetical protein [Krasilnikoviella flava]|uniref:hypothetical protein n=1 Tax=Krasilnikoviella flava TaxID=526729 RepID=UPI0009A59ED7|nr:hypothetical protein [Krasilnikoviella flava]